MTDQNNKQRYRKFTRRNFVKQNVLALAGIPLLKTSAFQVAAENTGLKNVFKNDFKIGTAIGTGTLLNKDNEMLDLIAREFNAVTAENAMKWGNIHPAEHDWNFKAADRLVEFGLENNMCIQGHVLIWHSQVPHNLFTGKDGNQISKKDLINKMEDHIAKLVSRYKGKIHGWDVVNEAITPEEGFRKSKWFEILGPRFMEKAFHLAHEADPAAHLIYNDYGMTDPKRRDLVVELVKRYKREGVPIHGIGMQGHFNLDSPSLQSIEKSIETFASTGMRVHITELDVDVLPYDWERSAEVTSNAAYRESLDPYKNGLPEKIQGKLAQRYEELFKLFLKHRDKIDRISFWGTSDDVSWKNNFPVRGRTNYPLLFDREHQPKKAYYAVVNLKK